MVFVKQLCSNERNALAERFNPNKLSAMIPFDYHYRCSAVLLGLASFENLVSLFICIAEFLL